MKKQLLFAVPALSLCFGMAATNTFATSETPFCVEGDTCYDTLQKAFDKAPEDNTVTTIYLESANTLVQDGGAKTKSGQNIIFDLKGKTYEITDNLVGSTGTETNAFQLNRGSTVTIKDGAIVSDTAKIWVQNYSDLTIDNVSFDAVGHQKTEYVLSNNFGSLTFKGNSSIITEDGQVAFDVYYWPSNSYIDGVTVNIDTTGTIKGKIEYGSDNSQAGKDDIAQKAKLNIKNGNFTGKISTHNLGESNETRISITGGTFSGETFKNYIAPGYYMEDNGEVKKINATGLPEDAYLTVKSEKTVDAAYQEKINALGINNLQFAKTFNIELKGASTLDEPVTVVLEIPAEYLNPADGYTRTFYLFHIHNGEATQVAVSSDSVISFSTKEFSPFILGYIDTKATATTKAPNSGYMTSGTNATASFVVAFMLAGSAIFTFAGIKFYNRKNS